MTLVLEIEYLTGVAFAAINPDSPVPDWPPQPDRVFSALVASWAARGGREDEAAALRWLEELPAPRIHESGTEDRTGAIVFVPPNDSQSNKSKHERDVLPALRRRQPRRFPATRPNDATIRFVWPDAAAEPLMLSTLNELASDTAYVGHSSSLTRCRFVDDAGSIDLSNTSLPERTVYPGRLHELRGAYARFEQSASRKDRPQRGADVLPQQQVELPRLNHFSDRWLLLEHVDGSMPDLRACAIVAKTIRDALLAGYERIGLGDQVPEVISGHDSNGTPTRAPHLAIIPLAFIGFPYADGSVLGYALVPPTGNPILEHEALRRALRTLAPLDGEKGRRLLTIRTRAGTPSHQAFSIELSPGFEALKASLDSARYAARARTFATVTPIALDRHLKSKGEARQHEIEAQVAAACSRIGLPAPLQVVADKHTAITGAPSAYPSGSSPAWMGWRLPTSLATRQLTHAVIRFAEPVDGPMILGAGRFVGLGLCLPINREA